MQTFSMKRILFFVPEASLATNGVFASQVGGLAKYVESLGAKTLIWDGVSQGHHWFFQVPGYFRALACSDKRLAEFRPTHIYVRTFASCLAAKELARKTGANLVYSMRGADVAEALMGKNFRAYVLAAYAAFCVRKATRIADHVGSVSQSMADWIKAKWGRTASVLPCCVADNAFAPSLTANHQKTVLYCGGLSGWQKIERIIATMKQMADVDHSLKFRFLTKDVAKLAALCESAGLAEDRWSSRACTPSEVPGELARADCGIILRDDTLVNRVASPIKVGEYLAAGLGVIASPCIGDVGKALDGKSFVKLVTTTTSAEELVAFINGLTLESRREAQAWTRQNLTYAGNHETILRMFS